MELQKWTKDSVGNPSESFVKMVDIISNIILSDNNIMISQQSVDATAGRIIATIAHKYGFVHNDGTTVNANWTFADGKLNTSQLMNRLCLKTEAILRSHIKGLFSSQEWVRQMARNLAAEEIIEELAISGIQPSNNF